MIIFACLDDNGGMLFNNRRQSKDSRVIEKILEIIGDKKIWMNHYTNKLFEGQQYKNINIDDNFLSEAAQDDYCLIEGQSVKAYEPWIEKIILFKWNRSYPYDVLFDISLRDTRWKLSYTEDFMGSSHDKITMEVYE